MIINGNKVYIVVLAKFEYESKITPLAFRWGRDDEILVKIQKLRRAGRAAAYKAGGTGLRFDCILENEKIISLYKDDEVWFAEVDGNENGENEQKIVELFQKERSE